jgi:hypothetical protein
MNGGVLDPGQLACVSEVKAMRGLVVGLRPRDLAVVGIRREERSQTLRRVVFGRKGWVAPLLLSRRVRKESDL